MEDLDKARLKSPTDFAIANYVITANVSAISEYCGTMDRPDGCIAGGFFTCSSGSSASYAYNVNTRGSVYVNGGVNSTSTGVCPALLFNL